MPRPPKIPKLLNLKIYKTGQTRGADDDLIYQNRVKRNNTVLIPLENYDSCKIAPDSEGIFENGFIVLISPETYFNNPDVAKEMEQKQLVLGENSLLFYYSRSQWNEFNPVDKGFNVATSRTNPLGGEYVARVPSTTSSDDKKIRAGFETTSLKGAGIRVYEYASNDIINKCRIQLEFVYWSCFDSKSISGQFGMSESDIELRKDFNRQIADELDLMDVDVLIQKRILDAELNAICPLCLEKISANGFYNKVQQAEGRAISDLTVTQLNLFHIDELRTGQFNHKPYNLGWGHHHCNTVVRDMGIDETLVWMDQVVERNVKAGLLNRK